MAVLKPHSFLDDLNSFTNSGGAVSGTPTAPAQPSIGDLIAKQQEQEAQIKRPYAHGLTPQPTQDRGLFDLVDNAPVVPRQTPLAFVQSLTPQHVITDFINDTYKPEAQYLNSDKFKTTVISPTVSATFAQGKQL